MTNAMTSLASRPSTAAPATAPRYVRLVKPRGNLVAASSVWMSDDHLLLVTSSGIQERYQRFFFSDIKGFLIERSRLSLILGLSWGGLALFSAMIVSFIGLVFRWEIASVVGFSILPVLVLIGIIAWALGRSRRVFVVTRVQTTLLPSIRSRRHVRKFLARIHPLIAASQAAPAMPDGTPSPMAPVSPS